MAETITINLSGANSTNKYYVLKEGSTYGWTDTVEDAESVLALYTGTDEVGESVAVKIGEGDTIVASNATGVAISACAGFTVDTENSTVTAVGASGAVEGTLTYDSLEGLSVAVKTAASASNNTGASSVTLGESNALTVSKGVEVAAADTTYTEAGSEGDSTMALTLTVTGTETKTVTGVELTEGAVSVEAGGSLTAKNTVFENTDDDKGLTVATDGSSAVVTPADGIAFTATTGTGATESTVSYSYTTSGGLVALSKTTDGNVLQRTYTGAATVTFNGSSSLGTVKNGTDTPAVVYGDQTEYIAVSGTSATVSAAQLTLVAVATGAAGSYSLSIGDGKADGTEYATVKAASSGEPATVTKTVATTANATGKLKTITLGAAADDVTISAKLANAAQAYGKDYAVSFVLGGKTVQLTDANAAALVYDYEAATTEGAAASYAYTIPANAVLVGLTGTAVTVNSVSYTLNGAAADITGGATDAANTAVLSNTSNSTATVVIGSNTYEMAGGTEAAVSVVTAETDRSSLTLTAGELGLYVAGKTGDATENEDVTEAITVGTSGSVYTLVREKNSTTARDLTVSSKGVVSDLNDGDVFTVGDKTTYTVVDNTTGHYVVERAVAGESGSETYTFTIYDGKASLTSATFSAAATTKVLTVGEKTYEGQTFQSYQQVEIADEDKTWTIAAGAAPDSGVAFFGTTAAPATLSSVEATKGQAVAATTAADIVAAYKAAQYQLYKDSSNVVLAGGAAAGTATTVDLTALGAVTVVKGEGLNSTLLNFVTQNGSFALADNTGLISIAQAAAGGTDTISGKVAVTLSAGAEKYSLATLGATATIAYTEADDTTTLNGVAYSVETEGKTAKLTVGADSVDTLAIASGSTVKVGSASYKATADSSLKVDHSAAPVVSAYSGTFELADSASLKARTLASGELQTITAASGTTVGLTVAEGVVTKIAGFGNFAADATDGSESITIDGVTYTVAKVTDPDTSAVTYTLSNGTTTKTLEAGNARLTALASSDGAALSQLTGSDFWLESGEYILQTEGKLDLATEATDLTAAGLGTKILTLKTTEGTAIATLERSGSTPFSYTLKKSGDANVTLAISGQASGAVLLTDGFGGEDKVSLVVAKGTASKATVNGVEYDNASADVTVTVAVDGSGSYLALGTVKLAIEASDVAANNSVTTKDGSVVTILGSTASDITVTNTGVVSGLEAGDTFTISNSNGIATRYEVGTADNGKITITATGGYNASYGVTAANIGNITITSNLAGADAVADTTSGGTVTLKTDNTVTASLQGGKYTLVKALVDATGAITGYTTEVADSAPSTTVTLASGIASGAVIGYFSTTVTNGAAKVAYTGSRIGAPVTLDAAKLSATGITMTAGDSDPDNLRFINVPAGASVTVGTTNYAETASSASATDAAFGGISYARSYTLGATRKITLSEATSSGIKYYKVTPGTSATKGFVSCTLEAVSGTPSDFADSNYFKVTYESGTKTYKVEYVPATTESAAIDLTDSSWAGIVVSGTGIDAASIVTVEPTGAKDTYAVTVPVGVDVTADSAVSTTWTGAYTTAGSDSIALGAFAELTGDTVVRYATVTAASSKGITTVDYGELTSTQPTSGSYLTFTKTGTTLKVTYTKAEGGPSLTGMTTDGTTAQGVALDFSGLTSDNIKVVDIDDTTGTGGTVDYALTNVPAGTTFKGASFTSGSETTATAGADSRVFATSYKSDITLTLPTVASTTETKYISLKATTDASTGFTTYDEDGSWGTSPDTSKNQFKVEQDGNGNYTLTYVPASTGAYNLSGLNVTIDATGVPAKDKSLTANTKVGGEAVVGSYTVTNLTVGATATADDTSKLSYTYVESFVLAEGAEVDLTGLDAASGTTFYYKVEIETDGRATTSAASNRANKGKTTYKITKATEQPTEGSYITATYQVDGGTGKVNISYTTPDTVADKIDLTSLPVTVDASGLETTTVDEFSVGTTHSNVNYEVTGLPKSVTTLTKATSDVVTNAYRITYEFASGEESGLVVTNEGTRYFEVSSAYGTGTETNVSQKGVKQISLANADTTKPTDTTKNYFTVTNTGTGVTIKYTAATTGTDIIDLSTAPALQINASGLDANVTSIEILDGGDANYKFTDVKGSTTVTKTDEGSTVDVTYAATYQTEGKITLSSEGTGLVFFDVTSSVNDKNVATYTISEGKSAPTGSNYFTVDYRVAGQVSINYTSDGTKNFVLKDKVAVAVDAESLPAGVTALNVAESTDTVKYALTNVAKSVTVTKDAADTVSYAAEHVWSDSAKSITLNATANQFYEVTEAYTYATDGDATTPVTKVTYSVASTAGTTKPTSGKSYFAVTYDSAAGSYKIRYFKGSGINAQYDFAEGGLTLTVNAGSQSYKTIDIDDTSEGAQANYALTGVAGGTTVTGIDEGQDTVTYATGTINLGADGTYYLLPDASGNVTLTTGTSAESAAGKTYLAATVTAYVKGDEVTGKEEVPQSVSFAWMTPNATTGVMEAAEVEGFTGTITVTPSGAKFVAPETGYRLAITGVTAGQEITVPTGNTNTTIATASLNSDDAFKLNGTTYTSGASGSIKLNSYGQVLSGTLAVAAGESFTAAVQKEDGTAKEVVKVLSGDGVTVVFDDGPDSESDTGYAYGIKSITSLGTNESIQVTDSTGKTYTYTSGADGTTITRTGEDGTKKAGLLAENGDIFSLNYVADTTTYEVGGFSWSDGTYYLGGVANNAGLSVATGSTKTAITGSDSGKYYVVAEVTVKEGVYTLALTPKRADTLGQLQDTTAYTGTVTIAAPNAKISYSGAEGRTFPVAITNAVAGSSFEGLGALGTDSKALADSITTAVLAKGESVTVNGVKYTEAVDNAAAGLTFGRNGTTQTLWGITSGTVLLDGNSGTMVGDTGVQIAYTAGTESDGVTVTFVSGAANTISGLKGGESVTLTGVDGTKTVYTADAAGTTITKKETTATGVVTVTTQKNFTADGNVLGGSYTEPTLSGTLDWKKASTGYFQLSTSKVANVKAGETTVSSNGDYVVATTAYNETTGVTTLTLTNGTASSGSITPAAINDAAITVNVDAGGTVLSFAKGTHTAVFTNVGAQSVFTGLVADTDSVTTGALAQNAAIKVNNVVLISAAADNVLVVKGNATTGDTTPRIESGAVQIGGTYQGETVTGPIALTKGGALGYDTVYGTESVASIAYAATVAAGTFGGYTITAEGKESDGVLASFTGGGVTSITDLKGGEQVTVQYSTAAGGKKYVYTALDDAGTAVKCDIYASSAATAIESTTYCEGIESGANILGYTFANNTTVSEFNWTADKATGATSATGYFLISDAGAASVASQTGAAVTISGGASAGTHYLAVDVTTASDGTTTITSLKEMEVALNGELKEVASDEAELKQVAFTAPSVPVVFSKPAGLLVTMTGVTSGSVLSGFSAKDSITTVALSENQSISLGGKSYIAGADSTALTLAGDGKVTKGILKLSTSAEYGLSSIDTYYMNAANGKETTATVSYSSSEKKITGAVVTVANGEITGLTGLGADETVEITTYSTDSTGTTTATKTTYAVAEDGTYTKTEETAGVRTAYTLTGATSATDLVAGATVWTAGSTTSKTAFDWSNTGYFAATATKVGDTVTGYTASAATQTEPVSINATKSGQYYAKVVSTGNAAKGYTVSSISLVTVGTDGSVTDATSAAKPLTLAVTLPDAGNVALPTTHTGYTLALTNAQAGGVYSGIGTGDSITTETLAAGDTLAVTPVSGTQIVYTSAGAAALSLKNDGGKLEIQSGIVKLGANQAAGSGYDAADYESGSTVTSSSVAYTGYTDGIIATYEDGKVTSIKDLDATEGVTVTETQVKTVYTDGDGNEITEAVYTASDEGTVYKTVTTTTVTKAYTAATESSTKPATTNIGAAITTNITEQVTTKVDSTATAGTAATLLNVTENWAMPKVADVTDVNVVDLTAEGYSITSQFDWTTNAKGYFEIAADGTATVAKQTAPLTVTAGKQYVRIVTNGTTATTADSLMPVKYDATTGAFLEDTSFTGTITIPATGTGLAVPANEDRSYKIAVTGAVSAQTFTGLGASDTVTLSADSAVDDYITVNGHKFVAAQAGSFTVSGTGAALEGVFNVNGTDGAIYLTETADNGTVTNYTVTAGTGTAVQAEVKDGAIVSLKGLGASETLTVVKTVTPKGGSATTYTTTYSGENSATVAGGVTVTKVEYSSADGGVAKTTSKLEIGVGAVETTDVFAATYSTGSVSTSGTFSWTTVMKGYFAYDTEKKTATIKEGAFTVPAYDASKPQQFVEVTVADTAGTVSGIRLVTLDKDGSFVDAGSNFSSSTVITLTPDTTNNDVIKFVKPASANYALKVDGALASGSSLTGLKATDMVNSTTAGEVKSIASGVTIGGTGLTVTTAGAGTNKVNDVTYVGTTALTIVTGATAAADYLEKGTVTLSDKSTVKAYEYVVSDAETKAGTKTLMTVSVTDSDATAADTVALTADTKNIGTTAEPNNVASLTFDTTGLAAKAGLTVSVTGGGKTESYTVDKGGNITCSDGNTYYVESTALAGKTIELDGTPDTLVTGGTKVLKTATEVFTGLDNYNLTLSQTGENTYYATADGARLLNVTYAEATGYNVAAVDAAAGAKVTAIDTTALASDKVAVNTANMNTASITYKNADNGKTVIQAAGTVNIEDGEVSGVTALTLVSGAFETKSTTAITVTTTSSPATVGGVTFKGAGLTIMTSATNTGLVAGTVEAANTTLNLTSNGTAFTTAKVEGAATLTATAGAVSSIANLSAGESVVITSGTTVTTYEAVDKTHIQRTIQNGTAEPVVTVLALTQENDSFTVDAAAFGAVTTTKAGTFAWENGNKTYRLVASGIDLTAASTKSEFTYSDSPNHVYETAVAHTETSKDYTVTVTEKVIGGNGALADAAVADGLHNDFTIKTGAVSDGGKVTLVAPTAAATAQTKVFTVSGDQSSLTLKGNGSAVAGTFAYVAADGLAGSVSGTVNIQNVSAATDNATNTVTFKDGLVTAIGGLDANESVSFLNEKGRKVTYAVSAAVDEEGNYTLTRTVYQADGTTVDATKTATAKATLATLQSTVSLSGSDLAFTSVEADVTTETAGAGQGQFQWSNKDRGTGYFLINKSGKSAYNKINIADQSVKTTFSTTKSSSASIGNTGDVYMVASLDGGYLTLSARTVTVAEDADDGKTKVSFSDTTYGGIVNISVAKDAVAFTYDGSGDRSYSVNFTGVQAGANISGLGTNEKVTTVSLSENDPVTINGVRYVAGAKGTLTFQDGRLLTGTVKITSGNDTVLTYGSATEAAKTLKNAVFGGEDNSGEYIVKVTNGKITSITGLVDQGDSLTVTDSVDTVYTVLDADGTMLQKSKGTESTYATIKSGTNVYLADKQWKTADSITSDTVWSGKTTRYYYVGNADDLANSATTATLVESTVTGTPGNYYLAVTANNGTITGVKLMEVNAQGGLTASKLNVNTAFQGTLAIEANTALTYSAPASRQWQLALTGLAANSKVTNLLDGDTATTAELSTGLVTVNNVKMNVANETADTLTISGGKPAVVTSSGLFELKTGALSLTTYDRTGAETYKVTYGGGKDTIKVNVTDGTVTSITGLGSNATSGTITAEKITNEGKGVRTYVLKNGVVTLTEVETDGTTKTSTATLTSGMDLLSASYSDPELKDVEYNFTWTTEGTAGYFKLPTVVGNSTTVNVKTVKNKISDTASNYLVVKLEANGNGVNVKGIDIEHMTAEGMAVNNKATYSGKLALTVPNAQVRFDRSVLASTLENAKVSLTGAAAYSEIVGLKAGETVKTTALAENATVTVNQNTFMAGAKNTTLQVAAVDTAAVSLLAGKVKLVAGSTTTADAVTVGSNPEISVTSGTIVVSATNNGKGYTIEGIDQGETFTIGSYTYMRSEKTIIRTDSQGNPTVYNIGTNAKLDSSVINNANKWLTVANYNSSLNNNRVTIDLKAADAQFTKLAKADNLKASYGYVTDSVVDTKSAAKTNDSLVSTLLVDKTKQDWQVDLGTATVRDANGDLLATRTYTVNDSVGQNIKANSGWKVVGGTGADTITGAASGSDYLAGGDGDDTLVGGGASDTFIHSGGNDTIRNYISGKDTVEFTTAFSTAKDNVTVTGTNVKIQVSDGDSVTLVGAASASKGVTINNGGATATYYFGNGTKATTFTTFTDGAYYYGAAAGSKLTVGTDKTKGTKTTLGDAVTVDLTTNASQYVNISEVNASGSANKVVLKAGANGSTLRGGTYQTTLKGGAGSDILYGGSGEDIFSFADLDNDGNDTVKNYDANKDRILLNSQLSDSSYDTSSNSDLKLTLGTGKTVTVEKAVNGKAVNVEDADGTVVSYYFAKSNANNTMTGKNSNTDVFIANYDAKRTLTIKNFETADTIKLTGLSSSVASKNYTIDEFVASLGATITTNTSKGITTSTMKVGNKSVLSVTGVTLSGASVNVTDGVATITKSSNS